MTKSSIEPHLGWIHHSVSIPAPGRAAGIVLGVKLHGERAYQMLDSWVDQFTDINVLTVYIEDRPIRCGDPWRCRCRVPHAQYPAVLRGERVPR